MNKKGGIIDIIVWPIIALIIVIFFAFWIYSFGIITTQLTSITTPVGTEGDTISSIAGNTFGNVNSGMNVLKIMAFALIIGMVLSILVSGFLVNVHPVFFVPYFLFTVMSVVLSAYISNAYEGFMSNDIIGATLHSFTAGSHIMLYLPVYVTIIGFVGMIILMIAINRDRNFGGVM